MRPGDRPSIRVQSMSEVLGRVSANDHFHEAISMKLVLDLQLFLQQGLVTLSQDLPVYALLQKPFLVLRQLHDIQQSQDLQEDSVNWCQVVMCWWLTSYDK